MSSPFGAGGGDVDRAVTGAHADYHREIQQHAEPDGLVDDVVTYRMLAPHLMRTLLFLVTPTVLLLLKVVLDYLASMSTPDDLTDVVSSLLGLLVVVLYLAGIASFFAPAKEPIAEHSRLLENRGDAATSAFEYVRAAAEARQSPAEVRPSTVAGVPVLLFSQYSERAMLLVQPYGRDLYVGWTMWRSRSTATLLVHFLRDTFGRFAPAPRFSAELRAAATRALRESVHSLSREGVAAATHLTATPTPAPPPHPSAPPPPPPAETWRPEARDHHDHRDAPEQPGALPTSGPHRGPTGTDTGGWTAPRPDDRRDDEDERVAVRREKPRGRDDDGWGPPPRDRW
ncbi:hypothetical protein ACFPK1_21465 [Actinomycetospora rhizophila]|uniref:Uncharacterized protein n=1 Tax=Actinomycetospora rhizophila TaxID=1416876 RepID=A0ABV9ZKY5_9PSEU